MIWHKKNKTAKEKWITEEERISIIEKSSKQVSRGVFFATVIIITSFFFRCFYSPGRKGKCFTRWPTPKPLYS